jgi:hypothetical protein
MLKGSTSSVIDVILDGLSTRMTSAHVVTALGYTPVNPGVAAGFSSYIAAGTGIVTQGGSMSTAGQGAYFLWNKNSGDGGTWIVNQKGGGGGGFSVGEYASGAFTLTMTVNASGDMLVARSMTVPRFVASGSGASVTGGLVADGINSNSLTLSNPSNPLTMGAAVGDKINLYSQAYGLGIAGGDFQIYSAGIWSFRTNSYAGTTVASISNTGLISAQGLSLASGGGITSADTVNGVYTSVPGTLGSTLGNTLEVARWAGSVGSNESYTRLFDYRNAPGAGWPQASRRIQQRVDGTDMGFIEFNALGYPGGISFGTGATLNAGYALHIPQGGGAPVFPIGVTFNGAVTNNSTVTNTNNLYITGASTANRMVFAMTNGNARWQFGGDASAETTSVAQTTGAPAALGATVLTMTATTGITVGMFVVGSASLPAKVTVTAVTTASPFTVTLSAATTATIPLGTSLTFEANTGTNFSLYAYDDQATIYSTPILTVARGTQAVTFNPGTGGFVVNSLARFTGSLTATSYIATATSAFTTTLGTSYLYMDGASISSRITTAFYVQNVAGTVSYLTLTPTLATFSTALTVTGAATLSSASFGATISSKINLFSTNYGMGISNADFQLYTGGQFSFRSNAYNGTVAATLSAAGALVLSSTATATEYIATTVTALTSSLSGSYIYMDASNNVAVRCSGATFFQNQTASTTSVIIGTAALTIGVATSITGGLTVDNVVASGTLTALYMALPSGGYLSSADTTNGVLIQAGALGTVAGNTLELFRVADTDGNVGITRLYDYRSSTGGSWTTAARRLQHRIDGTDMGFIEFNAASNGSGISFGSGAAQNAGYGLHIGGGIATFPGTALFSGAVTTSAGITANNAEVVSSSTVTGSTYGQFRAVYSSTGGSVLFRNDGSNFYFLTSTTASGTWTALRPISFNLASGAITMGNGVTITGGLSVDTLSVSGSFNPSVMVTGGTTSRTLAAKLGESLSAADFGILPNGGDSGPGLQAAINYLSALGGGILNFGPGDYTFASGVIISQSNIKLRGCGKGSLHDTNPYNSGLTRFLWGGATDTTSTMVTFSPFVPTTTNTAAVSNTASIPVSSNARLVVGMLVCLGFTPLNVTITGINGNTISVSGNVTIANGQTLTFWPQKLTDVEFTNITLVGTPSYVSTPSCAYGLKILSCQESLFDLHTVEFTVAAVSTSIQYCNEAANNEACRISLEFRQENTAGTGLQLGSSNIPPTAPGAGNTCFCYFPRVRGYINNGTGIDFQDCDNNTIEECWINKIAGSGNSGVRNLVFRGQTVLGGNFQGGGARANTIRRFSGSVSANLVYSEGTETSGVIQPAYGNRISSFDNSNAAINSAVGVGATFFWAGNINAEGMRDQNLDRYNGYTTDSQGLITFWGSNVYEVTTTIPSNAGGNVIACNSTYVGVGAVCQDIPGVPFGTSVTSNGDGSYVVLSNNLTATLDAHTTIAFSIGFGAGTVNTITPQFNCKYLISVDAQAYGYAAGAENVSGAGGTLNFRSTNYNAAEAFQQFDLYAPISAPYRWRGLAQS